MTARQDAILELLKIAKDTANDVQTRMQAAEIVARHARDEDKA